MNEKEYNDNGSFSDRSVITGRKFLDKGIEYGRRILGDDTVHILEKKAETSLRHFLRDIEIGRKQFIALYMIFTSLALMVFLNLKLGIPYLKNLKIYGIPAIIIGFFVGILFAAFITDKLRSRYLYLFTAFIISEISVIVKTIIEVLRTAAGVEEPEVVRLLLIQSLIFINTAVLAVILVGFFVLLLEFTSLLERGRVMSMVYIASIITIIPLIAITYIDLPGLILIPALYPTVTVIYLYLNRTSEEMSILLQYFYSSGIFSKKKKGKTIGTLIDKYIGSRSRAGEGTTDKETEGPIEKDEEAEGSDGDREGEREGGMTVREIIEEGKKLGKDSVKEMFPLLKNRQFLRYLLVIFTFSIIFGLQSPITDIDRIMNTEVYQPLFFIKLVAMLVLFIIGLFILGAVFDFWGRRTIISLFILGVGVINFIRMVVPETVLTGEHFSLLMLIMIFLLVMIIPLAVGDLVNKELYGRSIGIGIFLLIIGLVIGESFQLFSDPETIRAWIALFCIIGMFILVHVKDVISPLELDWYESLYHLYIIHDSGILIEEYAFVEEDLATSDLISGGFIGLVTMLKEITRGRERLRAIDHGDKKLMFMYKKGVMFVLVAKYELLVLRNKLKMFANEFYERYKENIENFKGVVPGEWDGVKSLIEKYFVRHDIRKILERKIGEKEEHR